jgi:hypothetical protein
MIRPPPLPALTVHQPYAHLIAIGVKPVENRDWPPPLKLVGKYLAVHAGKKVDVPAYEQLSRDRPALWVRPPLPRPEEMVLGAIVAVARVAGAVLVEGAADGLRVNTVRILGPVPAEVARDLGASQWSLGPWLWVLEDVVQLPRPVPISGAQKIWTVHERAAAEVRAGWLEARASLPTSTTRSTTP